MKISLKIKTILIASGILALVVFVIFLVVYLPKRNIQNSLNDLRKEISGISLSASDFEDISLDNLIPEELSGEAWQPKISPQVNFVQDEGIILQKPTITLQPPEVKAKGISPKICQQFAPLPSCDNVPSAYKETCLQCRKLSFWADRRRISRRDPSGLPSGWQSRGKPVSPKIKKTARRSRRLAIFCLGQ